MLTVDLARLGVRPRDLVLDLGCGSGRHAYEILRRGARVVALDRDPGEVGSVKHGFATMAAQGGPPDGAGWLAVQGEAAALPFPDRTFDVIVAAEVLEHIPDDQSAIAELARVLRTGGVLAVTVPRWWPERVCWALSEAYHRVDGGHVRVYRRGQLLARLRRAALRPIGRHHAHALHAPYWWLRCVVGIDNSQSWLTRSYHRFLVYDIMRRPRWTRLLERVLNPVLGKSMVIYATAPDRAR